MATFTKTVTMNRCERCGYEWQQRRKRRPRVCPECKARDWDKPRAPQKGASVRQELVTA